MNRIAWSRREFLRTSALAAVAACSPNVVSTAMGAQQSNADQPLVGCIGVGGRGLGVSKLAGQLGRIVAICDVDLRAAEKAKGVLGVQAELYQDYRKLLDRKDIAIIVNATPDHWHTAVNVAACRSGKDVYGEKPMTLTIDEGKLLRKVVKQTGRIVQVGTQQRSEKQFQTAVELVRNGRIGKLEQVWVGLPYYTTKGGPFATQPVPPELNWDLYQGQAPQREYCPQRARGNFRWWYEYAGGIITDWGNHHMDIACWGMDCETTGPTTVDARGLFPNPKTPQHYNTPDRFFSRLRYPSGVEVLFFSSLNERRRYGDVGTHTETSPEEIERLFGKDVPEEVKTANRDGITFVGNQGRIFVNRGGVYGKAVDELKDNPLPANAWHVYPSSDHMANFFDCVKTRQQPCATVEIEHRTITACHLTNISIRLNRKLTWDPQAEQIVGDAEADAMLKRQPRTPYGIDA